MLCYITVFNLYLSVRSWDEPCRLPLATKHAHKVITVVMWLTENSHTGMTRNLYQLRTIEICVDFLNLSRLTAGFGKIFR